MSSPLVHNPYASSVQDRRMGDYTVDHDNKVRFHSGNVSGWRSLPISFTPGPRLDSAA